MIRARRRLAFSAPSGQSARVSPPRTASRSSVLVATLSLLSGLLIFAVGGCAEGECEALRPPLIHLDGRTYTADLGSAELAGDEIGAVVFTVSSDRSTAISSCDWDPVDGDSSLPIGSEFHAIIGVDPADELAANFQGRFLRFSV